MSFSKSAAGIVDLDLPIYPPRGCFGNLLIALIEGEKKRLEGKLKGEITTSNINAAFVWGRNV